MKYDYGKFAKELRDSITMCTENNVPINEVHHLEMELTTLQLLKYNIPEKCDRHQSILNVYGVNIIVNDKVPINKCRIIYNDDSFEDIIVFKFDNNHFYKRIQGGFDYEV